MSTHEDKKYGAKTFNCSYCGYGFIYLECRTGTWLIFNTNLLFFICAISPSYDQINMCLLWWRSQSAGTDFHTQVSYQQGWVWIWWLWWNLKKTFCNLLLLMVVKYRFTSSDGVSLGNQLSRLPSRLDMLQGRSEIWFYGFRGKILIQINPESFPSSWLGGGQSIPSFFTRNTLPCADSSFSMA